MVGVGKDDDGDVRLMAGNWIRLAVPLSIIPVIS